MAGPGRCLRGGAKGKVRMIEIFEIAYRSPIATFCFLLVIVVGVVELANLFVNKRQE